MTIKVLQRDSCPATWFIGRQIKWRCEVLELVEIDGDQYTWIDVDKYDPTRDTNNGFYVTQKAKEPRNMEVTFRDPVRGNDRDPCVDNAELYGELNEY